MNRSRHPRRGRRSGPPDRARGWRVLLASALGGLLGGCGGDPPTAPDGTPRQGVTHVQVSGELDVGNQALIARAIRTAKSTDNTTLVLDLDTPGGAIDVLWSIQKLLFDGEQDGLTLVTWIHDHAISSGALVALTSKRIYITARGSMGGAAPVKVGPQGIEELPPELHEKVISVLGAQFKSIAELRGRPPALAVAMIDRESGARLIKQDGETRIVTGDEWDSLRESGAVVELVRTIVPSGSLLTLTAREAVELRMADGIADDLGQVIEKLGLDPGARVASLERSNAEWVVTWLARLTPLFLLAGLVLGYLELKMPGFGVPGILAIVCFALLLTGQYLAGLADVPHIVAVALGVALIAVEIFLLPGTLWLGIAGLILVVGGLIYGSLGPGFDFASPLDRDLVINAAARILVSASIALVVALLLSRWLPKMPGGRRLVLAPSADVAMFGGAMPEAQSPTAAAARPGALGQAISELRPVGKVVLDGSGAFEWEARSSGRLIPRGARVRVVEVSPARLVVESAEEPA